MNSTVRKAKVESNPQQRLSPTFFGTSYVPYLIILLLVGIGAFFLGSLYTKVTYLEKGLPSTPSSATTNAPSLVDSFKGYAKQLKLDEKKFSACLDSGKYKNQISNDMREGSSMGVFGTPGFFVNGKFLGGAFPLEAFKDIIDKELNGTGSQDATSYIQILQDAYNSQNKSFDPVPKNIPVGNAPVRGDSNAKVTIIEYSDFQCPFCSRALPTVEQILTEYKGQVRLVYKHLPLTEIHPNAYKAAEAAECAKEQNKFWEYHDVLFKNQQAWSQLSQT